MKDNKNIIIIIETIIIIILLCIILINKPKLQNNQTNTTSTSASATQNSVINNAKIENISFEDIKIGDKVDYKNLHVVLDANFYEYKNIEVYIDKNNIVNSLGFAVSHDADGNYIHTFDNTRIMYNNKRLKTLEDFTSIFGEGTIEKKNNTNNYYLIYTDNNLTLKLYITENDKLERIDLEKK